MTVMTLKEASQYLKVAEQTLYNWSSRRKIASVKLGGLKFTKEDLDAFIQKCRRR